MRYDEDRIRDEIENAEPGTKFYFGCDSRCYEHKKRKGEWWISYATVIVVHIGGANGCRVYGLIEKERDYSGSMRMRLVREAHKATEMVLRFEEDMILNDIHFEVHLDINSDKNCKSNIAMKEAGGYVIGMLGIEPLFKPDAWAASHGADQFEYKTDAIDKVIPRRRVKRHLSKIHESEVEKGVARA